jgi:ABC-2 type transport system permease protein
MTALAPPLPAPRPDRTLALRVLRVEVRDELLAVVRDPTALFFAVLMPVLFFALFLSIFGSAGDTPTEVGTTMLATFGTFGVLMVGTTTPGVGLAADRDSGWLRIKQAAAVPLPTTLAAKVVATLPYAAGVVLAMAATAAAMGRLDASGGELVRLVVVLLMGSTVMVPFALAVGALASTNAAIAILNAILFPMVIASGLWMPLEVLPDFIGSLAVFMPPYHLAELALAQLHGGSWADHVLALVATGAVGALVAGFAYRHLRP